MTMSDMVENSGLVTGKLYRTTQECYTAIYQFKRPEWGGSDILFYAGFWEQNKKKDVVLFYTGETYKTYLDPKHPTTQCYYIFLVGDEKILIPKEHQKNLVLVNTHQDRVLPERFVVIANDRGGPKIIPNENGTTIEKIAVHSPYLAKEILSGNWHF